MHLTLEILLLLMAAGGIAGFVDAIAGGGGLLALPMLIAAGLPPILALGTNKVQSVCGTSVACATYARAGHIELAAMRWPILGTLIGAGLGATIVQHVDKHLISALMPLLLVAAAGYFLFSPAMSEVERHRRLPPAGFALVAAAIGFYDGFFGPGTGSFFAIAFIALMGFGVTRATAHTKLLNLVSNLVAVAVFAAGGDILWTAGLAMAIANMAGGWLGAHSALRWGAKLIKPLLVAISLALTAKLLLDPANPWVRLIWG